MTDPNRIKIKEDKYNRFFDVETNILYQGRFLEQVEKLWDRAVSRTTNDTIRIYMEDENGNIIKDTSRDFQY